MAVDVRADEVDEFAAVRGLVGVVREGREAVAELVDAHVGRVLVGGVREVVESAGRTDGVVAFEERERERGVHGGHPGVGAGGDAVAVPGRLGAVGDGGGEFGFEERRELIRRADGERDVVGVDVLRVVRELIALREHAPLDLSPGKREEENFIHRERVGGMAFLVAVHVRVLVEREFARHRGRCGLPGDVEDVVVVVVARPRALVRVLADVDVHGLAEVVVYLEDVTGTEKRCGRTRTLHENIHVSR